MCDSIDPVTDPDNPHIKIKNMQIVNGCQTSSSLAKAAELGLLKKDTRVLLRIYETGNTDLVSKIVLTTNNQNKITGRNLRSNDKVQADVQENFKLYNLYYERKPREFDKVSEADKSNIISNDIVATAYLAICLRRCGDSRSRNYKVWNDFYESIFHGASEIEPYVFTSLLYKHIKEELTEPVYSDTDDERLRYLSKNASFHIARIASFLIRKDDTWNKTENLKGDIYNIKNNKIDLKKITKDSFDLLLETIDMNKDLNNSLKSSSLDTDITRTIYNKIKSDS